MFILPELVGLAVTSHRLPIAAPKTSAPSFDITTVWAPTAIGTTNLTYIN